MKRHRIIAEVQREEAPFSIQPNPGCQDTRIDFLPIGAQQLRFGLGSFVSQLEGLGLSLTETALDLLILATCVYAADMRINRYSESQDGWTREIEMFLPVSAPSVWKPLTSRLADALRFLTGDRWTIDFRGMDKSWKTLLAMNEMKSAKENSSFSCVSLLSGGLDSYIGAIDLLSNGEKPLFVSHSGEAISTQHQVLCVDNLKDKYGKSALGHIRTWLTIDDGLVENVESEMTQRSRSFLFFTLAAAAASARSSATSIYVPENGLISLNVPLDPLRLGALSTRTTHPYFVGSFNEVIQALGINAVLTNPYQFQTKGEMVLSCKDKTLLGVTAKDTMSCSSPTKGRWKGETPKHCGYCVPCLIRRAALLRGFGKDDTTYWYNDLQSKILNPQRSEGKDIRSFQLAWSRLKARPAIAELLIHKSGPLNHLKSEIPAFSRVYLDGMREVGEFLQDVVVRS